jgi:hypothetical protein
MKKYLICVAISVLSLSSSFGSASEPSVSSGSGGVTLQSKLENFQRARAHLEAQILALMPQVSINCLRLVRLALKKLSKLAKDQKM